MILEVTSNSDARILVSRGRPKRTIECEGDSGFRPFSQKLVSVG